MTITRKQLTLFVGDGADVIEKIRATYNPLQYELIAAHVTLCREDELEDLEKVIANIKTLRIAEPISIKFDPPTRFDDGKGVLLPAGGENETFQALRQAVLKGITDQPRQHHPHITLMHPRNSTCTDKIFENISSNHFPTELRFDKISLIKQENGGKWQVLQEFDLA